MKTEEGKIKDEVKAFLHSHGVASLAKPCVNPTGYYIMVVPTGYGSTTLDFLGHYKGRFFAIEAKRLHDRPTARQEIIIEMIRVPGGVAIWGDTAKWIIDQLLTFFESVDTYK